MKKSVFILLLLALSASSFSESFVHAEQQQVSNASVKITLSQAQQWARSNSFSLKEAQQTIDRNRINLKNAGKNLDFIPAGAGNGEEDAASSSAWKGYASSTVSYLESKKQIELAQDQTDYTTMKNYYDVLLADNKVKSSEDALSLALLEEKAAEAKANRGKISPGDQSTIIQTRIEAQKNVEIAKAALRKAIDSLNTQMGQPQGTVYELVDRPAYRKMDNTNLDTLVTRAISASPSVWRQEEAVKLAKMEVKYYTWNSGMDDYEIKQIDVDSAEGGLENTKDQLAESLKSIYFNLQQNDEQYEQMQSNLQNAIKVLDISRKKKERGFATGTEVATNQLKVKQIERNKDELIVQMTMLQHALNKPWSV
ncbi:TolC family protein [Paenibacillus polymyxa]|uniref:TolC family protein n=1 Tax=Paenibacillus polymyxa TaxID=1406 RepID=UPI002AB5D06A|nr:TolC family protein [Paenibacillus polymyxa]MDY8023314.1 TolC family protein [Paenibacillus polymyxa]